MLRVGVPVEQFWHRVPGGTARATGETLRALAALAGIDTRLVAAWHRPAKRHPVGVDGLGPVGFVPLPRPLLYEAWLRFGQPRVEPWTGPVDVVWAAAMVAPPSSSPLVATVHDLGFLDNPERNSRRGRAFFPRAWRAVVDRAELVVCPSQAVADDCRRHGLAADGLRVVSWGVNPPPAASEQVEVTRSRFGLPPEFALWVGTLEPRKNLPRLVEAVARIPALHLAVVGPAGWSVDGFDVLAPLADRAHRLGPVSDHDLSALYRAASVFVFPSLLEGFGLPVLEAMAHGTPVVTSAGTATAEVAGGAARLVDPSDPVALAQALEAALGDHQTTARLVVRGLERAAELSWSATAHGYAAVFAEAVDGP
jgi:glycosyltransferase involved in cell wall biosynthesis